VYWTLPDWLVIDDPKTETVIEQTAEYWVVAVAGDANTGPLDGNGQRYWNGSAWVNEKPSDGIVHWDNPYHIVCTYDCDPRAALITVVDEHPPRTRILQVDSYAVPSEVKIVVGKTVTVQAGDTEVDWIPPGTFPMPLFDDYSFDYPEASWTDQPANPWPSHGAPWAIGMLYPPRYDPDVKPEKYLYDEWRPDGRVTLRYAGPYDAGAEAPAFPASGETWADTEWQTAEHDAAHLDDNGDPGRPDWRVYNWVTGGSVLPDGKYFITVTATDDVGHTTGEIVGTAEPVVPHVVEIWIDNEGPSVTLTAAELQPDGLLDIITNGQMERGRPVVLYIDPTMGVADLDAVTFMYKPKYDYEWKVIQIGAADAVSASQPYSVTLSPLGSWSGISEEP
jgi:hypothetical protein